MKTYQAKFQIGQVIHHRLFDYTGVIFDVDPIFQGSDDWYEQVALSRPPKDAPWYHVLVHNGVHTTYVAEQNLEEHPKPHKINNPQIDEIFNAFDGSLYPLRRKVD